MSILPPPPVHPGQPVFSLKINGNEISREANNRLVSLSLTDNSGDEADTLTITLSDHDGKLELPPHNAEITIAIGYAGGDLVDKGKYLVDETAHDGAPDQLTIVARSADFRATSLPGKRSRSWKKTTLGKIAKQIAAEHKLKLSISSTLENIRVGEEHQTTESDTSLLQRLARKYDAQLSVKNGYLILLKRGGEDLSGKKLPAVTIGRVDIESHNHRNTSRDAYTGVKARWNNVSGGKLQYLLAGEEGNTTELPATYTTETDARNAAEAELAQLQRGRATLTLQTVKGRPEIVAGQPLKTKGIKEAIDSVEWVIKRVVHTIDEGGGFTTSIEAEVYQASAPVESEPEEEPEGG